jgi:hypothetical protein
VSLLADERGAISGANVTGNGITYTLGPAQRLRVETITFTYTASATVATRNPQVVYRSRTGQLLAVMPDLNDVVASAVVTYAFGVGLEPFCGVAPTGTFVQHDLPDTVLEPETTISLEARDGTTGAVIGTDAFTSVVLWAIADTSGTAEDVIPLLTPLALSDQVGDALLPLGALV